MLMAMVFMYIILSIAITPIMFLDLEDSNNTLFFKELRVYHLLFPVSFIVMLMCLVLSSIIIFLILLLNTRLFKEKK